MSEENKVPEMDEQGKAPGESTIPETKEEELVAIPFDYKVFMTLIDRAIKSIEAVEKVIEGYAIYTKQATDIYTSSEVLKRARLEVQQLRELDQVLAAAEFTNKASVNEKIRKRVVEELTKHFTFNRIDEPVETTDDLVVLDKPATQVVREKPQNIPEITVQERLRREARTEALREAGRDPSVYEQVFNQMNTPVNMEVADVDTDGLTAEEIATFQQSASVSMDPRAEALKNKALPKTLIGGSAPVMRGKNRGISRRE